MISHTNPLYTRRMACVRPCTSQNMAMECTRCVEFLLSILCVVVAYALHYNMNYPPHFCRSFLHLTITPSSLHFYSSHILLHILLLFLHSYPFLTFFPGLFDCGAYFTSCGQVPHWRHPLDLENQLRVGVRSVHFHPMGCLSAIGC